MGSQALKSDLVNIISNIENEEFLERITSFVKKEKDDFWNQLSSVEKEEILKGLDELEQGKRISYSEARKKIS